MQLHEATEVIEVMGQSSANEMLKEGWTLLAIIPSAQSTPWYILGRR